MKFFAETINKDSQGWGSVTVGVFQLDDSSPIKKLIGEYKRNYSTNFNDFAACEKNGRYFALYSPSYTVTRVMEIFPDKGWVDIGGEEKKSNSEFCPTDYYIPTVTDYICEEDKNDFPDWNNKLAKYPSGTTFTSKGFRWAQEKLCYEDGKFVRVWNQVEKGWTSEWAWGPSKQYESGMITYPPDFGFIAGCAWGDDSSWKIQYLHLTQIEKGIINPDERFGYIELPENLSLKTCIDASYSTYVNGYGGRTIKIAIALDFDLDRGWCYVPSDKLYDNIVAGRESMYKVAAVDNSLIKPYTNEDCKARWESKKHEIVVYPFRGSKPPDEV